MAKVILLNGSAHAHGCTATALDEMIKVFQEEGIETELIQVGNKDIRGCISCGTCSEKGKCVFDDLVNEVAPKFEEADGLVVGSPVYYASPNGNILSFLDRLFYSTSFSKQMKSCFSIRMKHTAAGGMICPGVSPFLPFTGRFPERSPTIRLNRKIM